MAMAIDLGGGGASASAFMQLSSIQELLTQSLQRLSSERSCLKSDERQDVARNKP